MTATCLMTNCRNKAPSGEAMCTKHRDREGFVPIEECGRIHIERPDERAAFLAGYNSGFYSAGNYFPEQSWERYNAHR